SLLHQVGGGVQGQARAPRCGHGNDRFSSSDRRRRRSRRDHPAVRFAAPGGALEPGCARLLAGGRMRLVEAFPARVRALARPPRDWGRRIGYLRARWPRPLGTRPPIGLAVCAIFRDEARYLAEWVSFHRVQRVERFYLYDNRSADEWRSELAPE